MGKQKKEETPESLRLKVLQGIQDGFSVQSGVDSGVPGFIDTGNLALNWVVSGSFAGGYPLGRIVEVFGEPSTGKSLLLNNGLASAQAAGGYAILDDVERAYDPHYGEICGIDNALLLYLDNTITITEHLDMIKKIISDDKKSIRSVDKEAPILVVLDSLAEATIEEEKEKEMAFVDYGRRAKVFKQAFRQLRSYVSQHKVAYLMSNHVYSTMAMYGPQKDTPGGRGAKFNATVRLETKAKQYKYADEKNKKDGNPLGTYIHIIAQKNRLTAPLKSCLIYTDFESGIDRYSGLLPILEFLGKVKKVLKRTSEEVATGYDFYELAENADVRFCEATMKDVFEKFPNILSVSDDISNSGQVESSEENE